ncbi:Rne/Rng family ribonuclease [Burkholderiales bacterium]|nr:Rne/Rng family ribonuclease [Burkholderiales bacterium]
MKRMLFNATHSEELRIAIVDGQTLLDLDVETTGKEQKKSNIYKGIITRVEPSLEAAFVNYGAERHGFLPFKEISRSYFKDPKANPTRVRIQDVISEGTELVVQVEKDERGNKGAALTTFISLAGRYLVLMPNNPRGGGVSRRIEGEERAQLRDAMDQLNLPKGMSVIARTAGIGRSAEELEWDLNYLTQLWKAVDGAAESQTAPFLIYQDASLVIRAIRDYFRQDIGEILIDTESIYEQAQQFMGHVMPHNVNRVKWYQEETPLFSRFQIEHQTESAYSRQVLLPSGGSIVIDHTEAMVSIDVNSARSTRGSDIEETARKTNIEAADEVARQLRLRDLGGLVVIDFIDMEDSKSQREVENTIREALRYDRARVQVGKISRFGLLELSRQRLQTSLGETSHITCPRCSGTGNIRSVESTALHVLRIVQEEAMKESTAAVHAQVPVAVASYLLNEKRDELYAIEHRVKVSCVLIPNTQLETPHYTVKRIRHDELDQIDTDVASYDLADAVVEDGVEKDKKQDIKKPSAAVKGITPTAPPPAEIKKTGFFKRLITALFGPSEPKEKPTSNNRRRNQRSDRRRGGRDDERNDRRRNRNDSNNRRRPRRGRGRDEDNRSDDSNSQNASRRQEAAQEPIDTAINANKAAPVSNTEGPSAEKREGQNGRRRRRNNDRRSRNRRGDRTSDQGTEVVSSQDSTVEAQGSTNQIQSAGLSDDVAVNSPKPVAQTERSDRRETSSVESASDSTSTVSNGAVETTHQAAKAPSAEQANGQVEAVKSTDAENVATPVKQATPKQAPKKDEPVVLPAGMTMIETSSSAGQINLDSSSNDEALEKAREERKRRRQIKASTLDSQSEPLQQVETQDDPN